MSVSKAESKRAKKRPSRVPMHKQNILVAMNREGFKRLWVNEYIGRVESYELAGWNVVEDANLQTHDGLSQVESQTGSVVRRVVNKDPNAPCKTAVLMEIPIELYEEDQAAEQAEIDETQRSFDKTMGGGNTYGDLNISHNN